MVEWLRFEQLFCFCEFVARPGKILLSTATIFLDRYALIGVAKVNTRFSTFNL